MRTIINPKMAGLMAGGADLSQAYNMADAGTAWRSGDFDLFPAGAGQISALIDSVKPVRQIVQEMVA